MRSHRWIVLALILACRPAPAGPGPAGPPAPVSPVSVDGILARLSDSEKVGQLIVPWLSGAYTALDDSSFLEAARWVDSLHVGGIIISVGPPLEIAAKLNALQTRSALPLLISADLEWGAAMRVVGATAFPQIMAAGATGDPNDAYTIGTAAALEGRAVGIHVNFAPDADLNNNPANPIINTRSFGEDPRAVSLLVTAYVRGVREQGMLATLKHFPGHGDTETDSHLGLPVIRADYARLDTVELVPFRAGIAAGADVVMSAHIAFPALTGGDDPGTLSPAVLTGLLRDSLHFRGLVVTDALTMGSIVAKYGAGEAAVRAFLAGSDLLLMPASPDSALSAMLAALASGRITRERLDSSVRRLLEIKKRLGLFEHRTVPLDKVMQTVGTQRWQRAAEDIAVRSITLVRDTAGTVRELRARRTRLALVTYADEATSAVALHLAELLRANGDTVDYFRLWPMSGPASYDSARLVIARAPVAVFAANVKPIAWKGNIALPDSLAALIMATDSLKPTALVSFGSPYLLNQTPTVKSYLIAWSGVRVAERAAARALLGLSPIGGHLPIRIPPAYPLGWGIVMPDSATPPPAPPAVPRTLP
ncbi:MAG TPA: glycoside hydrolase family 3 N-terminal domain-containing protein [Gemmatimonadales bacterium]|nr:glycoside hydrolase family 3 N-terminal domain-containing protein [Gemmatimonadales bacterium]